MKSYYKNKKVLIAGGSGLVGINLFNKLKFFKSKVISSFFKNKRYEKGYKKYNFLNISDCISATKDKDIVFICAVKGSGIKNLENNFFEENLNNIKIRLNLIEACRINKVKKVLWISSSTVYQPLKNEISENEIDLNLNPYPIYYGVGWSYRYIEKVIWYYNIKFRMDIKIIRTTSIYGPHDNFDSEKSHVIPSLIKKTYNDKFISVWGDKNIVRDFVFVEDLVEAMLRLLPKSPINFPVNFSSGRPTSIKNLVEIILKIYKNPKKIKYKFFKRSSAGYRVLKNSKINKLIKMRKRTKLESGLRKTMNWYNLNVK